ncbi:RNA-directed DNA polymerase, eukaryota, nucleotide-binding alpha-beta plait domain protein [Tanacetum coccineum]
MTGGLYENTRRQFSSNEDFTKKISHSVFVTNFPDYVNSRDLWNKCSVYGTVIDVFIPNKKSKAGKRFAFDPVSFKVFNLDRLVKNLCTIWHWDLSFVCKSGLVCTSKPLNPNTNVPQKYGSKKDADHRNGSTGSHQKKGGVTSYVSVVNRVTPLVQPGNSLSSAPALVLDEECVVERDSLMCYGESQVLKKSVEENLTESVFCHTALGVLASGTLNTKRRMIWISSESKSQNVAFEGDRELEALHLSVCKAVDEDVFKGIQLQGSLALSHLFYADDAFFMAHVEEKKFPWIAWIRVSFEEERGSWGFELFALISAPLKVGLAFRFRQDDSLWFRVSPSRFHGDKLILLQFVSSGEFSVNETRLAIDDLVLPLHSSRQEVLHRVCRWWEDRFPALAFVSRRMGQWYSSDFVDPVR